MTVPRCYQLFVRFVCLAGQQLSAKGNGIVINCWPNKQNNPSRLQRRGVAEAPIFHEDAFFQINCNIFDAKRARVWLVAPQVARSGSRRRGKIPWSPGWHHLFKGDFLVTMINRFPQKAKQHKATACSLPWPGNKAALFMWERRIFVESSSQQTHPAI